MRERVLMIRLTAEERTALVAHATGAGASTLARWARGVLLGGARAPDVDPEELARARREVVICRGHLARARAETLAWRQAAAALGLGEYAAPADLARLAPGGAP